MSGEFNMQLTGPFSCGFVLGAALGAAVTIGWVWSTWGDSDSFNSCEQEIIDYPDIPETAEECKMVLVVRKDLPMTKGKVAAQCAHAAVACVELASLRCPNYLAVWKALGQAKITLQCPDEAEIRRLEVRAARLGVVARHIQDAGRTQIEPGSVTVLGVGPAPVSKVNEITGHLKLY